MKIPKNAVEVECYHTWMDEEGIVRTKVKLNAQITLDDAKENSNAVNGFFLGKKFPILVDSRQIKSITREARHHFSAQGRDTKANAYAILINSDISRVVGNFFLGINKPAVPTKLFDNEEEAVEWLKQYCN